MNHDVLPVLTPFNREWFTSGTLAVQHCPDCDVLQHPPEELCRRCGRMDLSSRVLAPTGIIHSYTVIHYPTSQGLADHVPYAVLVVALDEAPHVRVVGDLIGADPSEVTIGTPVVAEWTTHEADGDVIQLPHWRTA